MSKARKLRQSAPPKSSTQVFLAHDIRMALHGAPDGKAHTRAECPQRIGAIYHRLMDLEEDLAMYDNSTTGKKHDRITEDGADDGTKNISTRFIPMSCRPATQSEIELVHTKEHYDAIFATCKLSHEELLAKTDDEEESKDLVWNEYTFDSALFAAGSAIDCVNAITETNGADNSKAVRGEIKCTRAISICRPPGHHASAGAAGGFCFFNNIVVAAQHALHTQRAKRVVILDWDVHHGNGTQDLSYDNEHILFISLHRFEIDQEHEYSFYPGTGRPNEVGSTRARGMNLNVAWSEAGMGDPEFAAALSELILPVISAFHPDLFLISAGFDAAEGDPIGDCSLTPRGYYAMTRALLKCIGHYVPVLAMLEGGYNVEVIASCMEAVALAFMDEPFEPALKDLVRAASLPREVLEELFGPIDEENAAAYDEQPKTDEQVERRQTMVRRGTAFGRQELLRFFRHPQRGDMNIESREGARGDDVDPPSNVKLSAIRDINTSMGYLRNCPFWKDLWQMNIVELHDIPELASGDGEEEIGEDGGGEEEDVKEVENLFGGMKI